MNAIDVLKADHDKARQFFEQYEELTDGSGRQKRAIVNHIIRELATHAAIEEEVFYPAVRARIDKAKGKVLESLEEHHVVKWTLSELESLRINAERFDAKVRVLIDNARHHMGEEEEEIFPLVAEAFGSGELEELGIRLEAARKAVPSRPHPRAPDVPPLNIPVNRIAGAVDRVRDAARRTGEKVIALSNKRAALKMPPKVKGEEGEGEALRRTASSPRTSRKAAPNPKTSSPKTSSKVASGPRATRKVASSPKTSRKRGSPPSAPAAGAQKSRPRSGSRSVPKG